MTQGNYMAAAADLAAIGGANAMKYYAAPLKPELKDDGTPVTIADRTSERVMRDWIEERFPDDGIIGEEYGVTKPDAPRRWVLDPIDGTSAFIRRIPFWGCLVGVLEGEVALAGAATFPALGESIAAGAGEGCWWNGSRAFVSNVASLADATVLTTNCGPTVDPARREGWLELAALSRMSRTWGDCVGYLLVATGRAEVMVDPVVREWDIAALMPVVTEAGGVFADWSGRPTAFGGSAVATNAALSESARRILGCGGLT